MENTHDNEAKLLLDWINGTLRSSKCKLRCSSLLKLRNGVIWCELLAIICSEDTLKRKLVNSNPKTKVDCLHNYLLLKTAFDKAKLSWNFDIKDLIDGEIEELSKLAKYFVYLHAVLGKPANKSQPNSVRATAGSSAITKETERSGGADGLYSAEVESPAQESNVDQVEDNIRVTKLPYQLLLSTIFHVVEDWTALLRPCGVREPIKPKQAEPQELKADPELKTLYFNGKDANPKTTTKLTLPAAKELVIKLRRCYGSKAKHASKQLPASKAKAAVITAQK